MLYKSVVISLSIVTLAFSKTTLPNFPISTFSIVAKDAKTNELGVAVQSKFIAVGSVVPYAKAGIGAVASQAWGNVQYGPVGLKLLSKGKKADQVISLMINADPLQKHRQVAIINKEGNISNHTGTECLNWAGSRSGKNFSVQGNLLTGPEVVEAMANSFKQSSGFLAERLIEALKAGQVAGGDKRGMQSAALLIVKENWGYGGLNDRFRDLRVDDHSNPIQELNRIYKIHRKVFPRPDQHDKSKNRAEDHKKKDQ
jgi:uncharacterized Ntn-hydrolase superfamily protein